MDAFLGIGVFVVIVILITVMRGLFTLGVGKAVDKTVEKLSGPSAERKKLNDFDK